MTGDTTLVLTQSCVAMTELYGQRWFRGIGNEDCFIGNIKCKFVAWNADFESMRTHWKKKLSGFISRTMSNSFWWLINMWFSLITYLKNECGKDWFLRRVLIKEWYSIVVFDQHTLCIGNWYIKLDTCLFFDVICGAIFHSQVLNIMCTLNVRHKADQCYNEKL